jgi:hypothetical protein
LSRPRSSTRGSGANPAARGARPGGRPGVFVTTPKSDIYVALLGVALVSMVLATLLLVMILGRYDFKITPG